MSFVTMRAHLNNAKSFTKHNRFHVAKYSLLAITIFSALVLVIELFVNRTDVYKFFEEEWGKDPVAVHHTRLIVDALVWLTVAAVTVYVALYIWVVNSDKLVATLIMTVLNLMSFIWDLVEYEEPFSASVFHQLVIVVEITLGFAFVFLLWKRRRLANSEVRYVAEQI